MEDKLVTLAILTYAKAQILKTVLESEGIEASIHNVNLIQPVVSSGVRVRIKESDLTKALQLIKLGGCQKMYGKNPPRKKIKPPERC